MSLPLLWHIPLSHFLRPVRHSVDARRATAPPRGLYP